MNMYYLLKVYIPDVFKRKHIPKVGNQKSLKSHCISHFLATNKWNNKLETEILGRFPSLNQTLSVFSILGKHRIPEKLNVKCGIFHTGPFTPVLSITLPSLTVPNIVLILLLFIIIIIFIISLCSSSLLRIHGSRNVRSSH